MDEKKAAEVQADPEAAEAEVVEADAVEAEAAPEAKMVKAVRFRGSPGRRLITTEDWAKAGVPDHAETWWNFYNDYTVRIKDLGLNDEQFARIILADGGFEITEVPESAV